MVARWLKMEAGHTKKSIIWLENWGFEPCVISLTSGEDMGLDSVFNHTHHDSINGAYIMKP